MGQRAHCEDRIRASKDTSLRSLPLHGFAHNQLWLKVVSIALDLLAWTQLLALHDHPARLWEPKRLRLQLFSAAGRLARGGRRLRLRLAADWCWDPARLRHQPPAVSARTLTSQPSSRRPGKEHATQASGTSPTRRDSRADKPTHC